MIPFIPAAAAAVKSDAISSTVGRVGEGLAGLVGDTAKDKDRRARAQRLEAAAMAGDMAALRQLAFDAFEPANGLPGDNRPVDFGKRSPPLTRTLSAAALKRYAQRFGGLPPTLQQYAGRLDVAVTDEKSPLLQQVLQPAVNTITDAALQRAAERTQETARQYTPLILGGAALVAVLIYAMMRRK